MIPFDILFFALIATALLVIAVELLYMRRPRRRASDRRRWSQVKPPDDQERDSTPVPDWFHKRKR
jgi:hypothetical protein